MLEDFTQRNKLVFKKNPTYRQDHYPSEGEKGDQEKGLLKAAGKRLPFLDKIIVSISEESTAGWLNFMGGNLDIFEVPNDKVDSVIINDQLPQELIDKGIIYASHAGLSTAFYAFNHEDPLFQGEKGLNLRRAISLAIDKEKLLKLIYGGLGEVAQSFLPNGIEGNISHLQSPYSKSDLKKAKELFKKTGQKMGLNITVETVSSTFGRNLVEFFRRELAQIGIELKAEYYTWPKLLERIKQAKTQSFFMSYVAASPDGGSLLSRFHSKEEGRIILYQSSEFDRLYEKAMTMPQSRERTKLYIKINQLLAKDVPVVFLIHKKNPLVRQAWLKNYKHGKFFNGNYKYYDIDLDVKKKLLK